MIAARAGKTPRSLRIAIATSGRFHVLDLARELLEIGHHVTLYSILPDARVQSFGFPADHHRSMLFCASPFIGLLRYQPKMLPGLRDKLLSVTLDRYVEARLEPCDVLIAMSGIFVRALRRAKERYGAEVWIERGSRHIRSQAEILARLPGARAPGPDVITRELTGYRIADRIVTPSRHVAESFARDPAASAKLFVNPYGTDLTMFPYHARERAGTPLRLLMVGGWSLRKGCDVLEQAVRKCENVVLRHVGPLIDLPFPMGDRQFEHVDTVPQARLAEYYRESDAFILASREEGLSVVLAQALATGLPVICTDRTGGEDLGHTPRLRDRIAVVSHDRADALTVAIDAMRTRLIESAGYEALTPADREALGWRAYAVRYSEALERAGGSALLAG